MSVLPVVSFLFESDVDSKKTSRIEWKKRRVVSCGVNGSPGTPGLQESSSACALSFNNPRKPVDAARRGHSCYDTTATTTAAADSVSTDQRPTRQLCYEPHVSVREAIDSPLNITLNVLLNEFDLVVLIESNI